MNTKSTTKNNHTFIDHFQHFGEDIGGREYKKTFVATKMVFSKWPRNFNFKTVDIICNKTTLIAATFSIKNIQIFQPPQKKKLSLNVPKLTTNKIKNQKNEIKIIKIFT